MRVASAYFAVLAALGACGPATEDDVYVDHDLAVATQGLNVGQAGGCDTSIVAGLTQQLVAELNCITPNTMVDFRGSGIALSGAVQPFLNPGAAAALQAAVAASGTNISLSSAYRSVAQQYLLLKWFNAGQCGITAAAVPGRSNHQSGRAIDVPSYSFWISRLEAKGWQWLGSSDVVHFDYLAAPNLGANSVLAFQKLWNKNNANRLDEDGDWGPATQAAMASSPAGGFPTFGCGAPPPPPAKGTLKGRVYELDPANPSDLSRGLASASVTIDGRTLSVDATGMYTDELAPGSYTVEATAPGFAKATVSRLVVAGQTVWGSVGLTRAGMADTSPPEVTLSAPEVSAPLGAASVTLVGTVSDAQSAVASLQLELNGAPAQAVTVSANAFSHPVRLQPGSNAVRFLAEDSAGNRSSTDFTFSFSPGIDGAVLSGEGALVGASVTADDGHGRVLAAQTAGDGTFHFDLLPGNYTLRASAKGMSSLDLPFVVGADMRETATLTLMPEPTAEDLRVYGGCSSAFAGPLGVAVLVVSLQLLRRRRS